MSTTCWGPSTFTADATAALDWGLFAQARDQIDNYLTHFVRDDGSLLYRGPETGQYGRMLTVFAQYARVTGDDDLLLAHRTRIDAITNLLLEGWRQARELPSEHAAYGIIVGWCEADSCLEPEPDRHRQPYLSNYAEAARGIGDLAGVWRRIGRDRTDTELGARGEQLSTAAAGIDQDLQLAIGRSLRTDLEPPWLPTIAGAEVPWPDAVGADVHDPQFRAYRANAELLFSGRLSRDQVRMIVDHRAAHRDIVLGMPVAYGFGNGPAAENNAAELAGFLSYGHAYGLLQHDLVREYLLELYALSAHQYTRGSWTAPERRGGSTPSSGPRPTASRLSSACRSRCAGCWSGRTPPTRSCGCAERLRATGSPMGGWSRPNGCRAAGARSGSGSSRAWAGTA